MSVGVKRYPLALQCFALALVGCAASKQECQNNWDSYVVKAGGDPKVCEFNNYRQLEVNRDKAVQRHSLKMELNDLLSREVCPDLRTWLDGQRKKTESLLKELKAKKGKILDSDESFEPFSVGGTFVNWTEDESIFISSAVARNTYRMYEDTKSDLFGWGSFLIKDYPLIPDLRQRGFVTEEGLIFVGNTIIFEGLFYVGKTRLFNPRQGYFEVHTFSFKPPKRSKVWTAMVSELKDIKGELKSLEEKLKGLERSVPREVKEKCSRWVSPEKKKILSALKQLDAALEVGRSCAKIKEAYFKYVRPITFLSSCTQTLLEGKR